MDRPADFELQQGEGGATLVLKGDWTATTLGRAGARLATAAKAGPPAVFKLDQLGRFEV